MKEIIQRLTALQENYSDRVKLYKPATEESIARTESILKMEIHPFLKQLYRFSDGITIIDYCLVGINNKKINNFLNENRLNAEEELIFLGTSGKDEFAYSYHRENDDTKIFFRDDYLEDWNLISESFDTFFDKFISKVEILLQNISPMDVVMYFDDESLSEDLSKW